MTDPDLRLEDTYLEQLRSGFAQVRDAFADASAHGGGVTTVVGDPTLASRTRDFFDNWDKRRTELIEELDGLAEGVRKVAETFAQMDQQLAQSAADMASDGS